MALPFVTLDVFTTNAFRGNPVAILDIPLDIKLDQEQKQLIAREFNLSETVFLHQQTLQEHQSGDVRIDIFTPWAEVPFAGHPTVGTANYLLRYLKSGSVKALQTKAGRIPIKLAPNDKFVELEVAHNVHIHKQPFASRSFGHYPVVSIVKGMTFILVKLANLEELAEQTQNLLGSEKTYSSQNALDEGWRVGIVPTHFYVDLGQDNSGVRQLRTRNFGSREDPATGSAASALCSYLALTEESGGLRRRYQLTQGVEMGRESNISIEVVLNYDRQGIHQVLLSGSAIKVMEGIVDIPQVDVK